MNRAEVYGIVGFVIVFLLIFSLSYLFCLEDIKFEDYCISKGYARVPTDKLAEPGYFLCCKDVYENHMYIDDDCKGFLKTEVG